MGVDTRVQIPPYVRLEEVAKMVAKYCGDPGLKKDTFSSSYDPKNQIVDFDKPAGAENRWYHNYHNRVKTTSITTLLTFEYQAFGQINKQMNFHFDTDNYETRFLGYRIISARSNPLNVAICKKIVEHFGGYIQYSDSSDEYDLRITDKKAIFKKADWISDDSDTVYYRLVNSVDTVKPMTVAELDWAKKHSAYDIGEEQEKIALNWIQIHQDKIMLENKLEQKNKSQQTTEKFKI